MERGTFLERLAQAIRDEIPAEANRKSWFGARSVDLDVSEPMLRAYAKEENECTASTLLRMFELWGSNFEAKVRGTSPSQDSQAQAVIEAVEEVLADARKGLHEQTRVVPLKAGQA